jgi:hypothetical protein
VQVCELLTQWTALELGVPITIVLDNARYQRCPRVLEHAASLGIELLFLPPYSPNLNLIERLWKSVKRLVSLPPVGIGIYPSLRHPVREYQNPGAGRQAVCPFLGTEFPPIHGGNDEVNQDLARCVDTYAYRTGGTGMFTRRPVEGYSIYLTQVASYTARPEIA